MSKPESQIDNSVRSVRVHRLSKPVSTEMKAYWEVARILARSSNEKEFGQIYMRKKAKIIKLYVGWTSTRFDGRLGRKCYKSIEDEFQLP